MSGLSVVPFQGSIHKRKINTSSAIDNVNEVTSPLDFSFCRYGKIEEAKEEEPRASPRKTKEQEKENRKCPIKSVRLNNNSLSDISEIRSTLAEHEADPAEVEWIDLSFNELTTIDPAILDYERLQILYFHGNQITDLREIEKLQQLKHLRKLTLHGNVIENQKFYKQYVLSKLPDLQSLDFSLVTNSDRMTARTWNKSQSKIPKKQKTSENDD